MHRGETNALHQLSQPSSSTPSSSSSAQYGIPRPLLAASRLDSPVIDNGINGINSVTGVTGSNGSSSASGLHGPQIVNVKSVDEALRRLSGLGSSKTPASPASSTLSPSARGKRIAEYERAMMPSYYRREKGPQVVLQVVPKTAGSASGKSLNDLPNEILTHVFSYLQPGSHGNVALVSKRFCALVTTPHAWRLAFLRHFSGHVSAALNGNISNVLAANDDLARSELRQFARLTNHASWRSEYLQRTGLFKSLMSGRPGASIGVRGEGLGTKGASAKPKKATAVITYNTPLLGPITHMQAMFVSSNKKTPRVVHGSSMYGVATSSNPQLGRSEGWGYHEIYVAPQFEEEDHTLSPYGLGRGRVGIPNVMDTSQLYGVIVGEGWPGGRPLVRFFGDRNLAVVENAPRNRSMVPEPDMPVIPETEEGVSAVWAAKSPSIPTITNSMIGFLVGSSLGVISAYSLDKVNSSSRYPWSHVTARWVLCPGVPIIAITADDNYSEKRRAGRRIWAVALNALGEVYYLQDVPPSPPSSVTMPPDPSGLRASYDRENLAWKAGRSVAWELVEASRRIVTSAEFDSSDIPALKTAASPSPRLSPDSKGLDLAQRTAEAREIEKFFKLMPWHFCTVYDTWDMRRKLEVDFAGGSTPYESSNNIASGIAENIVVISCGLAEDQEQLRKPQPPSVVRYTRLVPLSATSFPANETSVFDVETSSSTPVMSIVNTSGANTPTSTPVPVPVPVPGSSVPTATLGWQTTVFALAGKNATPKSKTKMEITCSALDLSNCAVLAPFDDPLLQKQQEAFDAEQIGSVWSEVPGRRARWLAVGTNSGQVIIWNVREHVPRPLSADAGAGTSGRQVWPMRIIRSNSPSISSLAVSSLYLVHGGSDGLVQAWDPLASSTDSIRTLNAPSAGRVPRHLKHLLDQGQGQGGAGTLRNLDAGMFAHVGAIVLDPDPTELRGVLAVGTQLRFWSYSSLLGAVHGSSSRKRGRRLRHADGQLVHRSAAEKMATYIASETADLRRELEHNERNREHMMQRFGVGLAGLTDEEAIQYAELISQREYLQSQQILSSSDSSQGSAGDDAALYDSSSSPPQHSETSVSGQAGASSSTAAAVGEEDDFELQMQRAMRLSLMEGVNEEEASSPPLLYPTIAHDNDADKGKGKEKEKEKAKASPPPPPPPPPPAFAASSSAADILPEHYLVGENEDDDFQLALQLSMREEAAPQTNASSSYNYVDDFDYSRLDDEQFVDPFVTREEQMANDAALAELLQQDDFPALEPSYVGKGKGKK